jgi:hypothetical protein
VSGQFVGAELPGLPEGMDWNIDYGSSIVSLVTTIPGDYNSDASVDAADYIVWRKTFGQSAVLGIGADGDGSGTIDDGDYTVWRANFGRTAGAGSLSNVTVPEPAKWMLLIFAATLFGWKWHRRSHVHYYFEVR